ncbi:MAG: septation protein A [Pseudomonadota bacterium]
MKQLLEFGPLLLFFAVYFFVGGDQGFYIATGVLVVASVITLAASRILFGAVPMMPLVSTGLIVVFGALTLLLQDKTFVKMKPTIVYCLFAAALLIGLAMKKPFIKYVMGEAMTMREEGWRGVTIRWAIFFLAMAALNEVIWRTMSESFWVTFKVFGAIPLTVAFAIALVPYMRRHGMQLPGEETTPENRPAGDT